MSNKKIESKITRVDGQLIMQQDNIDLEFDGVNVGKRTLIDTYPDSHASEIVEKLEEQLADATNKIEKARESKLELMKNYNKREEERIKGHLELMKKLDSYNQVQNLDATIKNLDEAVEVINKQLSQLKE